MASEQVWVVAACFNEAAVISEILSVSWPGTEAGRSAPDEGIQHRVCEHQYQGRGLEQR